MRHGSLFSGIGGFDLAAEWMGWENVFHCEINPFAKKVLIKNFPNSISYDDITKTDFTIHRGGIDIVTGGWPCPKYSNAGKQEGNEPLKQHLINTTKTIRPRWFIFENVPGLITPKLSKEHASVIAEMESEDYETITFSISARNGGGQSTSAKEYGLSDVIKWETVPTPREGSWEGYKTRSKRKGHRMALSYLETLLDFIGMKQYPEFTEYLMGYPEGWTDIETEC